MYVRMSKSWKKDDTGDGGATSAVYLHKTNLNKSRFTKKKYQDM